METSRRSRLFAALLLGLPALGGCSGWDAEAEAIESIAASSEALSAAEDSLQGFESLGSWSTSAGALALSSVRSEGASSLSVSGTSYAVVSSVSVATTAPLSDPIQIDVRVPDQQPNPYWKGQLMLHLNAPSRNVHNAMIGERPLTGVAPGSFHTLSFALPAWLKQALAGTVPDLSVRIVLNVPAGSGPHLFDRLRLIQPAAAVIPRLPPWMRACLEPTCDGALAASVKICPTDQPDCAPARTTTVIPRVDGTPVNHVLLRAVLPEGYAPVYVQGNVSTNGAFIDVTEARSLTLASDVNVTLSWYDVAPVWGGTTYVDFASTVLVGPLLDTIFFRHVSYDTGSGAADLHGQSGAAIAFERDMLAITSERVNAFFVPTEFVSGDDANFSFGDGTITVNYGNPPHIANLGGITHVAMPRFAHENAHELFDEVEPAYAGLNACLNEGVADAVAFLSGFLPEADFGPQGLRGLNFETDGCLAQTEIHDIGNCPLWHVKVRGQLTPSFLRGLFHPARSYDFDSCHLADLHTGNSLFVLFTDAAGGADVRPALDAAGIPHAPTYAQALAAIGG